MAYLQNKKEIEDWLNRQGMNIHDLVIETDFTVNVPNASVHLRNKGLKHIPIKFGYVGGDFDIACNILKDLNNCPTKIGASFWASHNMLKDLIGAPKEIKGHFYCDHNELVSLEGCPQIGVQLLQCNKNQLKSLYGAPPTIHSLEASQNQISTLEYCPVVAHRISLFSNKLKSLKFIQKETKDFDVSHNELTSLEYCPEIIKGQFAVSANHLENLRFFPKSIMEETYLDNNDLLGSLQSEHDFHTLLKIHQAHQIEWEKAILSSHVGVTPHINGIDNGRTTFKL